MTIEATPNQARTSRVEDSAADRDVALIGVRLLEDAYVAWAAAASDSERALRAWLEPEARNRATAYPAYRAALDREEAAARDLQRLIEVTRPYFELLTLGELTAAAP
jgi:hypothetical protein